MRIIKIISVFFLFGGLALPQLRNYEIHKRGMLQETVFSTGEIGRAYHQGQAGNATSVPIMEWPGNSRASVEGKAYDGQHNSLGGGIYLSANAADTSIRLYAFCGAVGSSAPELVAGKWAFPLALDRKENYPLLSNGDLNPAYNPDEAEEIITAKWATPTGITVTRTSRAWSFPDYDDMIIYEYEMENTGDRDGDPATIESKTTLTDLLVTFSYGFAPNMFGYQRLYGEWLYTDFERKDQRARFDRTRWLNYNLDMNGKPDPKYYDEWGVSGKNGGGLNSPGAVGYSMLYFDTQHLAKYGETLYAPSSSDSAVVWDQATMTLKQPWMNYLETTNLRSSKMVDYLNVISRKNLPYKNTAVFGSDWVGRGRFNARQTRKAGGRMMVLGPYTLKPGEKLRFAMAEVAGYGAARLTETIAGLKDEGGSCGEDCGESADSAFFPVPNWSSIITYGGATGNAFSYGSTYLTKYKLPDYINSGVVTVREVADKAKFAYTGDNTPPPYWPEKFPEKGNYKIPIPVPAPVIAITNNTLAQNEINWGPQAESFKTARLQGEFSHYEVFKASHPLGPWVKLDSVAKADSRYFKSGSYKIIDANTRVGESFYYSVLSVDKNGNKSGRTNMTYHETQIGGSEKLGKIYVVPNPFIVRSGFSGVDGADDKIGFYNLPKICTIRIFSYSGQLIETIEHNSGLYSTAWFRTTRNDQNIASGLYFYVVKTPDGKTTNGKFVVIR